MHASKHSTGPRPLSEGPIVRSVRAEGESRPDVPRSRSPLKPLRADVPTVRSYSRGSLSEAVAIAKSGSRLAEARDEPQDDFISKTGKAPLASKKETWTKLAVAAGHADPVDLHADLIYDVMAAFRRAGYRSAESYLVVAKGVFADRNGTMDASTIRAVIQIMS